MYMILISALFVSKAALSYSNLQIVFSLCACKPGGFLQARKLKRGSRVGNLATEFKEIGERVKNEERLV
jgi:hypothetical protein